MTVAVCIASGPSLTKEDVDYCRDKAKVYVVNNGYQIAPWADVLYACDGRWWDAYHEDVKKTFKGELWSIDTAAICKYNLNSLGVVNNEAWSKSPDAIVTGGNSGFQVMNFAYIQGAKKIILLGYDMKPRADGILHWHGNHIPDLTHTCTSEYPQWVKKFKAAAPLIDIPVINCTRDTALDCFPKLQLRDVL
jgi:hypothetical protein